jgi:hypothetical protein
MRGLDDENIAARLVAGAMVDVWAKNSTGGIGGLAYQMAAADFHGISVKGLVEFHKNNIGGTNPEAVQKTLVDTAQKLVSDNAAMLRELVRAEYEVTQEFLRENGITEVTLFRGVGTTSLDIKVDDVVEVNGNPLSSWSTDKGEAVFFARGATYWTDKPGGKRDGLVLEMTVPAEMIQSLPVTGRGCLLEHEAVLIGFEGSAKVLKRFTA